MMFKKIWKTYIVDVVALLIVLILGVVTKNYIGNLFTKVELYQEQVSAIEGELVNQTLAGLVYMEQIVNDFSSMVVIAFIIVVFLLPLLLYLVIGGSQILNIGLLREKLSWKYLAKGLFLGVPLLIIFLFIENSILNSFAFFLDSSQSMFLLILYLVLGILGAYIWAVLAVRLSKIKSLRKLKYKLWYKKFFRLFPLFFLMGFSYLLLLGIISFAAIRYITKSFTGFSWLYYVLIVLVILGLLQVLRVYFVKAVDKAAKSL